MQPLYESVPDDLEIYDRPSRHFAPHVHMLTEFILCLSDTLELGVDTQYYHMEQGDLAVIFPGKIHHSQYFGSSDSAVCLHLLASTSLTPFFETQLRTKQPQSPIIKKDDVDPDIVYALERLYTDYAILLPDHAGGVPGRKPVFGNQPSDPLPAPNKEAEPESEYDAPVKAAFLQLILARCLPKLTLVLRSGRENTDLVYRMVNYIASHFKENLLLYTDRSVTDIWLESGFESQRTFNRVFREKYHMSPRDYRKAL